MRTFEVDLPEHMKFKSPEDQEKSAKQVVTVINNEPLFTIKWRLTSWCNYRCSYCIQDRLQHYDKEDRTDFDRLLSVAKDVNRFIEESPRPVKLVPNSIMPSSQPLKSKISLLFLQLKRLLKT